MKLTKLSIAAVSIIALSSINAASNGLINSGSAGITSEGSVDIFLTVPKIIHVTNLNDITLPTWSGASDVSKVENFCVRTNSTDGYKLTLTSLDGGAGSFTLAHDFSGPSLPYTVKTSTYDGTSVYGTPEVMVSGTQGSAVTTEIRSSADCITGGDNASIEIIVANSDLNGAEAEGYSDTLTVLATAL